MLAGITAIAVLGRLPHLGWGLPLIEEEALPMKKAFAMWGWSTGHIDWNPHTAGWPSLSFYLHLLIQHLHYAAGLVTGAFHDRGDYFVARWIDPGPLLRVSRFVSVIASAGTVAVAARLALRLAGRLAAWIVGGLLALAPLLIEHAQLVTPDVLAALFAMLAVDRIVWIAARDRRADDLWAGAWIGLGASSKYTPALLVPGLLVTHALRVGPKAWPRALAALAVAAIVFAATSPFLLLDRGTLARDVAGQVLHLTGGHFGSDPASPSLWRYLTQVLGPGLGVSGLLTAIAGLGWGVWRGGGEWRALAACIVPYYLALALLRTQFPRYALPLAAPVAVGVAGAVAWIRATSIPARAQRALWVLLAIVAWAPAGIGSWHYHQVQARPSTRALADRFIRDVRRAGPVHVAAEVLALSLPTSRAAAAASESARLSPAQRSRMMSQPSYDVDYLPMYAVQPEEASRYYDLRHFTAHDFIVVTDAVRSRYLADTIRFATEARFYRELDRFGVEVARFTAGRTARGPDVRVYRLSPETAAWIEGERGARALPPWNDATPANAPDYLEFMEGVARAAYEKGRWAMAARYYGAMLQAGEAGWMPEVERLPLMRLLGFLEDRSGSSTEAIRLYQAYLARVPGDSVVRIALDRLRRPAGRGASLERR